MRQEKEKGFAFFGCVHVCGGGKEMKQQQQWDVSIIEKDWKIFQARSID